jgi:hypothetical protein
VTNGQALLDMDPAEAERSVRDHATVTTADDQVDDLRDRLAALPGVRSATQPVNGDGGGDLTVFCTEAADVPSVLDGTLSTVRAARLSVTAVRVLEPTLENAFLAIAGRALT